MPPEEKPVDTESKLSDNSNFWHIIKDNVTTITIALLVSLFIRLLIAEPRFIPSESMYPTLEIGDRVIVEKVSYRFDDVHRGDIVVFQPPPQLQRQGYEANQAFIKRAIATEGDTVAVTNGVVYVNDEPLQEQYIAQPPQYDLIPVVVPKGTLFVMGDNRNNSNDSHVWGFLPQKNIIGHAIWRFYPLSRVGKV